MAWQRLSDNRRIKRIIDYLVSQKTEIKVRIGGEDELFSTKFIKVNLSGISSKTEAPIDLIISKLVPEKGNKVIQSTSRVQLEFLINENPCRCLVKYIDISGAHPYFGYIVSVPEFIEIQEKRREDRIVAEMPKFVSVEFRVGKGTRKGKLYDLDVIDRSKHGLGILVTQDNSDLINILNPGDKLRDMTCYARSAMIRVNGIVKHITKIKEGHFKNCYILGIESPEIMENWKPKSYLPSV